MSRSNQNNTGEQMTNNANMLDTLRNGISERSFLDWHMLQERKRNEREGYGDTRNDPTHMPADDKHSPSQLLKCHRMLDYDSRNAPREDTLPYGIFKFGHDFEAYIEEYLRYIVSGADPSPVVDNVVEVEYELSVDGENLTVVGTTDPVILNENGTIPLALCEVKTISDTHYVRGQGVKEEHLAQAHAYAKGLEKEFGLNSPPPIFVIYGGREDLDVVIFEEEFDDEFWTETVVPWMKENTKHRKADELAPPVDPEGEKAYMCGYCDFAERCGNYKPDSESPHTDEFVPNVDDYWWDDTMPKEYKNTFSDMPARGFLPLKKYPEDVVVAHLASYPDVPLTPTLAVEYPELVEGNSEQLSDRVEAVYGVAPQRNIADWFCEKCMQSFPFDRFDWDGDFDELPECPDCPDDPPLRGPKPTELLFV